MLLVVGRCWLVCLCLMVGGVDVSVCLRIIRIGRKTELARQLLVRVSQSSPKDKRISCIIPKRANITSRLQTAVVRRRFYCDLGLDLLQLLISFASFRSDQIE
jgi:hypothetical protein